jgi:hypothetical protein
MQDLQPGQAFAVGLAILILPQIISSFSISWFEKARILAFRPLCPACGSPLQGQCVQRAEPVAIH